MKNVLKFSVFAICISSSAFLSAETLYYDNAVYDRVGLCSTTRTPHYSIVPTVLDPRFSELTNLFELGRLV